jgi:sn-glycerol 3-phosphate transport system ATP-binding protein
MSAFLELKGISKRFGNTSIIDNLDMQVTEGEFLVLVGPSGCGKSTILRLIAGLEDPTEGEVWIGGKNMNGREPKARHIAMVFQHYALYPHMSVYDNMAFGLRVGKKLPEDEIKSRVGEAADLLQLEKLLFRKPKELSGGQRQRVALGRALVRKPKVFLFDEPLSNLDAHLRNQMRVEIKKIQRKLGVTSIYVTHDQVEATTMGDRIAVLQGGKLQQLGSPTEVYESPANKFVAQFIGTPEMNFFRSSFNQGKFSLGGENFSSSYDVSGSFVVGIRPEQVKIVKEGSGLLAKVEFTENLGAHALIHARLKTGESFVSLQANENLPSLGSEVRASWNPKAIHFFHEQNGEALR